MNDECVFIIYNCFNGCENHHLEVSNGDSWITSNIRVPIHGLQTKISAAPRQLVVVPVGQEAHCDVPVELA